MQSIHLQKPHNGNKYKIIGRFLFHKDDIEGKKEVLYRIWQKRREDMNKSCGTKSESFMETKSSANPQPKQIKRTKSPEGKIKGISRTFITSQNIFLSRYKWQPPRCSQRYTQQIPYAYSGMLRPSEFCLHRSNPTTSQKLNTSCVCCVDSISADGTLDLDIFMNLEFSYMMQVL